MNTFYKYQTPQRCILWLISDGITKKVITQWDHYSPSRIIYRIGQIDDYGSESLYALFEAGFVKASKKEIDNPWE